jgi:hypothetical protein
MELTKVVLTVWNLGGLKVIKMVDLMGKLTVAQLVIE